MSGWVPLRQLKEAAAYGSYMLFTVFLPNAVNVVTLFYGGNLVLDDRMSAGSLVSFMLYVASLNGAFQARARPPSLTCVPTHRSGAHADAVLSDAFVACVCKE